MFGNDTTSPPPACAMRSSAPRSASSATPVTSMVAIDEEAGDAPGRGIGLPGVVLLAMVDAWQLGGTAVLAPRDRLVAVEDEGRVRDALLDHALLLNVGPPTSAFLVVSVSSWK